MSINLGTGQPFKAAIINTEPKQIRFAQKADQAYTIRINYVPVPTAITSGSQTLFIQEEWHELLYLKFIEKIANSLGEDKIELKFNALYDKQLAKDRFHASGSHLKVQKMKFRWL